MVSKKGVAIDYVGSCADQIARKQVDSFLNAIISKLNRKDTSLRIYIFVNYARIGIPFASISFDTLSPLDDDFIFDYYWWRQSKWKLSPNQAKVKIDLPEPIDINSTYSDTPRKVGLKIIYNQLISERPLDWKGLEKLILHAFNNLEEIKRTQKRINVTYWSNGYKVSLMTIDTTYIKDLLGIQPEPILKDQSVGNSNWIWSLLFGISIVVIATKLIAKR